jgi:hypothetical protein
MPTLVQRDTRGRVAGVYYEQLSTLLLAETRRQAKQIKQLERRMRRLETR